MPLKYIHQISIHVLPLYMFFFFFLSYPLNSEKAVREECSRHRFYNAEKGALRLYFLSHNMGMLYNHIVMTYVL